VLINKQQLNYEKHSIKEKKAVKSEIEMVQIWKKRLADSNVPKACLSKNILHWSEGFTSHSIQNRSFRRRSSQQISWL